MANRWIRGYQEMVKPNISGLGNMLLILGIMIKKLTSKKVRLRNPSTPARHLWPPDPELEGPGSVSQGKTGGQLDG